MDLVLNDSNMVNLRLHSDRFLLAPHEWRIYGDCRLLPMEIADLASTLGPGVIFVIANETT
jgi:hypothetical protein